MPASNNNPLPLLRYPLLLFLALCLSHASLPFGEFGHSDDYATLEKTITGSLHPFWNEYIGDGRPLTGWLILTVFSSLESVNDLLLPRLFALFFSFLFGLALYICARSFRWPPPAAFALALLALHLPAFAVYHSFAVCFPYSLGGLLAFLAGWLAHRILQPPFRPLTAILLLLALATTLLAETIYQPTAAFFLLPSFLQVTAPCHPSGSTPSHLPPFIRLWSADLLFALVMIFYFLLFRYFQAHGVAAMEADDRSGLSLAPVQATIRLLRLLHDSLAGWTALYGGTLASVVALASTVAILRAFSAPVLWKTIPTIPLSVAPVLLASSPEAPFRTYPALALIITTLLIRALFLPTRPGHAPLAPPLLFTFLSLPVLLHSSFLHTTLVAPLTAEWKTLRGAVSQYAKAPQTLLFLTPGTRHNPHSTLPPKHEFGILSSSYPWVPPALIRHAVRETGLPTIIANTDSRVHYPLVVQSDHLPANTPQNLPVLDARQLFFGQETTTTPVIALEPFLSPLPPWGSVLPLKDDWSFSPAWGFFQQHAAPWMINHALLGPVDYSHDPSSGGIYFKHPAMGLLWTRANAYPSS